MKRTNNMTETMITVVEILISMVIVTMTYVGFREAFFAETLKEVLLGVGTMTASIVSGVLIAKWAIKANTDRVRKEIEEMFEED